MVMVHRLLIVLIPESVRRVDRCKRCVVHYTINTHVSIHCTDANEQAKNKARRRGSELKILEQWGWHKNRRSTRKKSVQEVNDPVDATVDSFFKQAVKQHLS